MLLYRCGPLGWLHERRSGRWNKAALLGTVASVGWLNQAIKKASLTNAVLPPRSAFHQPRGRMKYASAEGNVPYLCPGGDKFIAHSAIYNPSEPRRSGSRYLSRAGVAPSVVAPAWRVGQWAAVWAEKGDRDNIIVGIQFLQGADAGQRPLKFCTWLVGVALFFSRECIRLKADIQISPFFHWVLWVEFAYG